MPKTVAGAEIDFCHVKSVGSDSIDYPNPGSIGSDPIDHLTIAELEALNRRIVERLKFLDTVQAHRDMMALNLGAKVSFESSCYGR